MSIQKFIDDLEKETKSVLKDVNTKIKNTGKTIQDSLMSPKSNQGTPVRTGHLKSNFVVTIDREWLNITGSRQAPSDSLQQSNWTKFINKDDLYLSKEIFWNNNVYYGPWVNYGVGQPAQHFREKAIQRGNDYINSARNI